MTLFMSGMSDTCPASFPLKKQSSASEKDISQSHSPRSNDVGQSGTIVLIVLNWISQKFGLTQPEDDVGSRVRQRSQHGACLSKNTHFWTDEETSLMLFQLKILNILNHIDGRKLWRCNIFKIPKFMVELDKPHSVY